MTLPSKNSYEFLWEWVVKLNRLDLIEVANEFLFEHELQELNKYLVILMKVSNIMHLASYA